MAGDASPLFAPLFATLNVAAGGAIGAACRYNLGRWVTHVTGAGASFPWATLAANVLGCLAMGLLFGWLARNAGGTEGLRLFFGVGILGGFTTFSAFSLEMLQLIQRGSAGMAVVYAGVSVMAGLAALYAGLLIMRGAAT